MTDNQTTELLPCPFCGGEAQVMHMDLDSIEEGWKVWGVWGMLTFPLLAVIGKQVADSGVLCRKQVC